LIIDYDKGSKIWVTDIECSATCFVATLQALQYSAPYNFTIIRGRYDDNN